MSGWQTAQRNAGFAAGFSHYLHWLFRRNFAAVRIRDGMTLPKTGGYVGVANHHSWWDGFVPLILHRRCNASRPFAIMMSDRELRRFPYFRMLGVFSIDATSTRAARDAILYAAKEAHAGAGVWILPDGILRPPQVLPAFTSGFVHAARMANVPIIPLAMRFVFLGRRQPEVLVAYGEPLNPHEGGAQERAQTAVTQLLALIDDDCRNGLLDARYSIMLASNSRL